MTEVRIMFSGLVGFCTFQKSSADFCHALLPEVDVAKQLLVANPQFGLLPTLPRHRPRLRIPANNVAGDSLRKPEWLIEEQATLKREFLVFLKAEDLSLVTSNANKKFEVSRNQPGAGGEQPVGGTLPEYLRAKSDFKWAPKLDDVLYGKGRIDRDCIVDNKLKILKARFLMDDGLLGVHRLAGSEEADEMKPAGVALYTFDFAKKQAIAEKVILRVNTADNHVFLKSTAGDDLKLVADGGVITVYVENVDAEFLLEGPGGQTVDRIDEFGIFYELCDNRPAGQKRRTPFKAGGGGGQRICPVAEFPMEVL